MTFIKRLVSDSGEARTGLHLLTWSVYVREKESEQRGRERIGRKYGRVKHAATQCARIVVEPNCANIATR